MLVKKMFLAQQEFRSINPMETALIAGNQHMMESHLQHDFIRGF